MAIPGMSPVLTARAQREADRLTMEEFGISSPVLMETAGRAAAAHIRTLLNPIAGKHIDVLVGKGNNGGDGYVVARVLHAHGAHLRVWEAGTADILSPDAAHQRSLLARTASHAAPDSLSLHPLSEVHSSRGCDLYVDALLGTGLTRPLRTPLAGAVQFLNEQPTPVVAIDIPTGLHADTGHVLGHAVRAHSTVTMGALSPGHLLNEGPAHSGTTVTADIGIPSHLLQRAQKQHGGVWLTTDAGIKSLIPRRPRHAHKYSAGMVLAICGSPGMTGAAVMASQAAARMGAGYVTCATHASVQPLVASILPDATTLALPEESAGALMTSAALECLHVPLQKADALLVGPGLGQQPSTQHFVRTLLKTSALPAVIDADGLNSWVEFEQDLARHAQGRWILTPHAGELRRLAGEVDLSDPVTIARHWGQTLEHRTGCQGHAQPGGDS